MLTRKYGSSFHYFFTMKYELSDWSISSAVKENSGLVLKRFGFDYRQYPRPSVVSCLFFNRIKQF